MKALLFHKFRNICIKTILWTRNTNCFTIFVHWNFRRKGHSDCEYHLVPRPHKWGLTLNRSNNQCCRRNSPFLTTDHRKTNLSELGLTPHSPSILWKPKFQKTNHPTNCKFWNKWPIIKRLFSSSYRWENRRTLSLPNLDTKGSGSHPALTGLHLRSGLWIHIHFLRIRIQLLF